MKGGFVVRKFLISRNSKHFQLERYKLSVGAIVVDSESKTEEFGLVKRDRCPLAMH